MIFRVFNIEGDEMGLIVTPSQQKVVKELFSQYHNMWWEKYLNRESFDYSLSHFMDFCKEKGYDVNLFFTDGNIYPEE